MTQNETGHNASQEQRENSEPVLNSQTPMPFIEQDTTQIPPYAYTQNGGMHPYEQPAHPYNQPSTNQYANTYPYPYSNQTPQGYPGIYPPTNPIQWNNTESQVSHADTDTSFNFDFIDSPARIAIYDNFKSAPRVVQIQGAPTHEYIERIASLTYKHAKEEGGVIPYTVIREVSENFIHAKFQEIVVSIMDHGNTIRFADQGPGITNKDLAQEPGFSSAIEPMKRYIRGVGSGLPIVKDYLDSSHGYIQIEDNINRGSVVTISLVAPKSIHDDPSLQQEIPELTENEQRILQALLPDNMLGITEMNHITGIPVASIHTAFSKMEQQGLVKKTNKKRALTFFGQQVAQNI